MAVPWNGIHPWTNDVDARGRCAGISATELHQRAGEAEEGLLYTATAGARGNEKIERGGGEKQKKREGAATWWAVVRAHVVVGEG